MLVDQAGALRWASASGPGGEAVAGALSMPVEVGAGPVGTLDVYVSLVEQAVQLLVDREDLDRPAALGWLETSARSSGRVLVEVARAVVGGVPLPSDRLAQARVQRREATDLAVAACGRIIDAEAEQRRADQQP